MKTCSCCKNELSTDMFYKDARYSDGLYSRCKDCHLKTAREWQDKNADKVKAKAKQWRTTNAEYLIAWNAEYRKEHKDKIADYQAQYKQNNLSAHAKKEAKRRARKMNATPSWLTEDDDFMFNEFYEMAKIRTADTDVEHHVDHIVPLQGENVSGLHVWWNLQLLPASENISKSNKWEVA